MKVRLIVNSGGGASREGTVKEAEISSNRAALILSMDGETVTLATPLRYRILPGALILIVPER